MTDAVYTGDLNPGPSGVPRITIPLAGSPKGRPAPRTPTTPPAGSDPTADLLTDYVPANSQGAQVNAAQGAQVGDPTADLLADYEPAPVAAPPKRQVGTGEAIVRGGVDAGTLGLAPTLEGLNAAGHAGLSQEQQDAIAPPGVASEAPGLEFMGRALTAFGNHPDPTVRAAFEKGRQDAVENNDMASSQHRVAYFGGQLLGGIMALPGTGSAALPASLAVRAGRGAVAGGIGAGLYAAGTDVSHEVPLEEMASDVPIKTLEGAGLGTVLGGGLGPRATKVPTTSGQRAASTATNVVGESLPRGVVSDRPWVQNMTAAAQSIPLAGTAITQGVKRTEKAAGDYIGDVANSMHGGINTRGESDVIVRPGMQRVIDDNKAKVDALYDGVRSNIDRNARFTMPRTSATLDAIVATRKAAGWPNPEQGLEQFRNVSRDATFDGAHRARVDAREAGNPIAPHPGYNAADYNRLTRAMTADIRDIVGAAAKRAGKNPPQTVAAFDKAEREFGPLKEQNDLLDRLVNAAKEGGIGQALSAAREKSGDARLLAQLKAKMPAREFEQIGGMILEELGANPSRAGGTEFSLARFVKGWNDLSPIAKRILFDPGHLQNLEDIMAMGQHIKGALEKSNRSHTGDVFVLYETLTAAIETAVALNAGLVTPGQALGTAAAAAAPLMMARFLAIPKNAASMAKFSRAWQTFVVNPSPARIGVLTAAARNMANTIGIEPGAMLKALQSRIQTTISGRAEDQSPDQQQ